MKKIHYQLCNRANIGTEDNPVWHTSFVEKVISYSEDNLAIAQAEGYNGEYTIEDDGQPEPDTTSTDDVLNALLGVSE